MFQETAPDNEDGVIIAIVQVQQPYAQNFEQKNNPFEEEKQADEFDQIK